MTDTTTSTALVETDRPGRYGKQLCSHLGRRASAAWDDAAQTGRITFGDGAAACDLAATDRGLELALEAPGDDLERLEDVVGRHLVRFGAKDELSFAWTRADGSTSGVHRVED